MARATRSNAQIQEKDKPLASASSSAAPTRSKGGSKKRKRLSNLNAEEGQPATKQLKSESAIPEDEAAEGAESAEPERKELELANAGDVPLDPGDAERILDILEMVDTQGLLDRVFPLSADSSEPATSSFTSPQSYSFRTLLKESSRHPLRVLRTAVQHLFPISSHARSRPSTPAAQQLRFCRLALSLLDQASFHCSPIPLDIESILSTFADESLDADVGDAKARSSSSSVSSSRKRKYALMQRLPTGDWWTSLDSDFASPLDGKELKDLSAAHAELVAVFPTPSSSSVSPVPSAITKGGLANHLTIGTLFPRKPPGPKQGLPGPRYLGSGSFLDYGPYASFAPSFNQEGAEVGRGVLGEVLWDREQRRRAKQKVAEMRLAKNSSRAVEEPQDVDSPVEAVESSHSDVVVVPMMQDPAEKGGTKDQEMETALKGLLDPSEVETMKSMLDSLELEGAVHELLERNAKALSRLDSLQIERLGKEGGGYAQVEAGSEEWDTAQAIMDTLTVLASLRPRLSNQSSNPPLIPSDAVLRKLHRTLPVNPSQGWYGTIPSSRPTALRDDTTLRIKSGAAMTSVPTTIVSATPVASKMNPPSTPAPAAYPGYTYPGYAAGQYRAGGYTYTPGHAGGYYPNAYAQGQASAASYYGNHQYNASAAQQSQYSYSPWYNYQPPANGTAQPPGTPSAAPGTNYGAYYNAAATPQQPQPQRAVANTVLAKPHQASGTPGHAAPTLPSHLRPTGNHGTNSAPGTPQPGTATPGYQPSAYYGAYQTTAR